MFAVFMVSFRAMQKLAENTDTVGDPTYGIGLLMGGGTILFIWALGAIITGLLAILTRGSKVVTRHQ
jgi:hypothetical protein